MLRVCRSVHAHDAAPRPTGSTSAPGAWHRAFRSARSADTSSFAAFRARRARDTATATVFRIVLGVCAYRAAQLASSRTNTGSRDTHASWIARLRAVPAVRRIRLQVRAFRAALHDRSGACRRANTLIADLRRITRRGSRGVASAAVEGVRHQIDAFRPTFGRFLFRRITNADPVAAHAICRAYVAARTAIAQIATQIGTDAITHAMRRFRAKAPAIDAFTRLHRAGLAASPAMQWTDQDINAVGATTREPGGTNGRSRAADCHSTCNASRTRRGDASQAAIRVPCSASSRNGRTAIAHAI